MKAAVWIGAVLALVAAGVAIWLGTRDSGDSPSAAVDKPKMVPITPGSAVDHRTPPATVTPAIASDVGSDDATTYKVDTITIHDHRGSNAGSALDLPPGIHPPNMRQISPAAVANVSRGVRGVLAECQKLVPPIPPGPKPRMDGEIVISIKNGQATITKGLVQLRDTVGDVEPAKQCLEQKVVGVTSDAAGEADLDAYSIHMSFALGH